MGTAPTGDNFTLRTRRAYLTNNGLNALKFGAER
jgi:hypothetical protein